VSKEIVEDFNRVPLISPRCHFSTRPYWWAGWDSNPYLQLASISFNNGFQSIGPSAQFHSSGFEPFFPLMRRVCCHYTNNGMSIVVLLLTNFWSARNHFGFYITHKITFSTQYFPIFYKWLRMVTVKRAMSMPI
jgi:hypothetical protein